VSVVNINAGSHDETFVPVKTSLNPNTNIDGVPKFTQRCNADAWCTVATEAETAALALSRERLILNSGSYGEDLWLSATCAVVTASDGLTL
jgi:hypothetical protein